MTTEVATVAEPESGNILSIIARAAQDPSVDVDKLERLLAMQERVLQRDAEQAFNAAMRDAQAAMPAVLKNKKNEQTKSRYADLERVSQVMDPVIQNHGFSLSFGTADCPYEGHYRVTCTVSHVGGFSRDYQTDVPVDNKGLQGNANKTLTHGFGSALSYGRRYLKLLIFDVATTDDDGNRAGAGGTINDEQVKVLNELADVVGADKRKVCNYLKVDDFAHLPLNQYNKAVGALRQKNPKAADAYLTGGK